MRAGLRLRLRLRSRAHAIAIGVLGAGALIAAAAACANVADLDVSFNDGGSADAAEDTRQKVRESSVEVPDVAAVILPVSAIFPCDGGLGADLACDNSQGKGCCLANAEANCLDQGAMNTCEGVFVACRESTTDSACCWLNSGKTQIARFVGDCDGGPIACISDAGCPSDRACAVAMCAGGFEIGQCGDSPPNCP